MIPHIAVAVILIVGFAAFFGAFIYTALVETCERGVKVSMLEP